MSVISFEEQRKKLAKRGSKARYQSKQSTPQDGRGQTPIDSDEITSDQLLLFLTLLEVGTKAPTIKSRFARDMAEWIAVAASIGFITCRLDDERFAQNWMITEYGEEYLRSFDLDD